MTATPKSLAVSYTPLGDHNPILHQFVRPLAANAQVGMGQFVTVAPSTGYASLNDGTVPNQIAVGNGYPAELSTTKSVAGDARVLVRGSFFSGLPASTVTNDGFTAADWATPFFIADENTPGKLSNSSGSNRSIGGLVFGVDDFGRPLCFGGTIAWLLARSVLQLNATLGGWFPHPVDGAANTTTAEKAIFRNPVHGVVTKVTFTSLGTLAADNTDYVTINVYKADGAGGTHVLIASYDSRAANQGAIAAGVPMSFALSSTAGALNLLETDILSYEVAKAGAGKIVPVGTLQVLQKVI